MRRNITPTPVSETGIKNQGVLGYVCGKFLPLTDGHAYMLTVAATMCDHIVVHLDPEQPLVDSHGDWLRNARDGRQLIIESIAHSQDCNVMFLMGEDITVPFIADDLGTILTKEWWDEYAKVIHYMEQEVGRMPSLVFSSDAYGAEIARRMDATWIPVDPDRELYPIAATQVRADPIEMRHWMHPLTRSYTAFRVAVVGPESVGKSTLVKYLGKQLGAGVVPEYGRTIYEATGGDLTVPRFEAIMEAQTIGVALKGHDYPIVISDTEGLTTYNFIKQQWFPDSFTEKWAEYASDSMAQYDLYIILSPEVEFVQDGSRVDDPKFRQSTYQFFLDNVDEDKRVVITGSDYDDRSKQALKAVIEWSNKYYGIE